MTRLIHILDMTFEEYYEGKPLGKRWEELVLCDYKYQTAQVHANTSRYIICKDIDQCDSVKLLLNDKYRFGYEPCLDCLYLLIASGYTQIEL